MPSINTVVSWVSLDHGGPVNMLLAQTMISGWNQMPFFWERYGNYNFFIGPQMQTIPPPEENPTLDTQDAAMFAQMETSFPAMNQAIADSIARARITPPPAPSDPNSRKFWRVKVDWSIDTDEDGSPDWAEFEIAARGTGVLVTGVRGDAFNADTNGDGIPDGDQLDADLDGTADRKDFDPSDSTATFEITPLPRYALFPITNAQPDPFWPNPLQINDQGTVLYSNGTWTGGTWTPLIGATNQGEAGVVVQAASINDHGEIIGCHTGMFDENGQVIAGPIPGNLVYWSNPHVPCGILAVGEDHPWIGRLLMSYPGSPGVQFSNDGRLLGFNQKVLLDEERTPVSTSLDGTFLWTLPGLGRTPGKVAVPLYEGGVLDQDHYWGWPIATLPDGSERLYSEEDEINPPGTIQNLHLGPNGELIANFRNGVDTRVYKDGVWLPSPTYAKAIDISSDGIAIGRGDTGPVAAILLGNEWLDITRTSPDIPALWKERSVSMLDITPGGWILAQRSTNGVHENAVLLPIRVEGRYTRSETFSDGTHLTDRQAVGVDDFSIGSNAPGEAVKDRIWIMAPKGEYGIVKFDAPLSESTPLKISAAGVNFAGQSEITISENSDPFDIHATTSESTSQDIALTLKMNTTESISRPIGLKIMKNRVVRVNVFKICRRHGPDGYFDLPGLVPTQAAITAHLNDIFKPQINVTFDVLLVNQEVALPWDLNDDQILNTPGPAAYSDEQTAILDALPGNVRNPDITILIVGSQKNNGTVVGLDLHPDGSGAAYGITNRTGTPAHQGPTCWILGEFFQKQTGPSAQIDTMAHEIGHVFTDYGHPNSLTDKGPAPLPGTETHSHFRLMSLGPNSSSLSRLLVKGEWDKAEEWLNEILKISDNSEPDHPQYKQNIRLLLFDFSN